MSADAKKNRKKSASPRAKKQIDQNPELWRNFMEDAPVALAVFDREMHYIQASQRWMTEWGLNDQNIIGRAHSEVLPANTKRWQEILLGCLSGETIQSEGEVLQRADGSSDWFRWEARPWHEPDGTVGGLIMFVEDISEYKHIEDSLKKQGQLYRTLAEASQDMIFVIDREDHIQYVNNFAAKQFGVSPDALIGKKRSMFFTGEAGQRQYLNLQKVMDSGEPSYLETLSTFPHGELWVSSWLSPISGQEGTCNAALGISRDITEHKRLINSLHHREVILKAISFAAESFLAAPWWENINTVLARLGQAVDFSRAYIFENSYGADGELLNSLRFEWVAEGISPQIDNPLMQLFPLWPLGEGKWIKVLGSGDILKGHVAEMGDFEQDILGAQEIKSILLAPIFVDRKWWGVIGFDECRQERRWSEIEIDAIKITADELGVAIKQENAQEQIQFQTSLLDKVQNAVIVTDRQGKIIFWNHCAENLFQHEAQDVLGRNLKEIIFPVEEPVFSEEDISTLLTKLHWEGEFTGRRKDGSTLPLLASVTAITNAQGSPVGFIGIQTDITEQKKTLNALRESEERYRNLFENAPIGIYRTTPAGRIIMGNPFLARMLGYDSFDELAKRNLETDPPVRTGISRDAVKELLHTKGFIIGLEDEWCKRDGTPIFIRENARAITDEHGQIICYEGTLEDISEQRKAERAEAATYRISEAANSAPDLDSLFQSIHGIVKSLMPAKNLFIALYDPKTEYISFPYWVDEYDPPPASRKRRRGLTEYVIRSGKPLLTSPEVFKELSDNGEIERIGTLSLDWLGVPLKVGNRVIGVLTVQSYAGGVRYSEAEKNLLMFVSDQVGMAIERKRSEQALRESEEKFRTVAETANDAIITVNSKGQIVFWNTGAKNVFGYSDQEILGQPLTTLIVGLDLTDIAIQSAARRSGTGASSSRDIIDRQGRRKNGNEFPLELSLSSWGAAEGLFYTVIARDISSRKLLEEQLRQSHKMEAVGRLAGGVAHDFNNLLTAIIGFTDLLLSQVPESNAEIREGLDQIRKAGERAANLTGRLLTFSRRQILRPEVIHLNTIVAEMEKMLRRLIGEDIKLEATTNPEAGLVMADRNQVEQIILNLAINARDAMAEGGTLTISTDECVLDEQYVQRFEGTKAGSYVLLQVADTGCGMDPQTLEHLFEPFFTTKEYGRGTGLGLSTVYGMVKQANGFIEVFSETGKGSIFRVYLPKVVSDSTLVPTVDTTKEILSGKETILLVEDELAVRELTSEILRRQGYRVLVAEDGAKALETSRNHEGEIQLMLTDVVMPGIKGTDLAERLSILRPEMKVLFMSGYLDNLPLDRGFRGKPLDLLQKPFTPRTLSRKIREILDS